MSQQNRESQRRFERMPVRLRTKVVVSDEGRYFEGWYEATDASDGGLFASGGALLAPGTPLKVSLFAGEQLLELDGQVARLRDTDESWGLGIELTPPQPGLTQRLI